MGHAGWRRAKLCVCAISRNPAMPKLPEDLHGLAAEAVTVKLLAATIGAGGCIPQLLPCEIASTGRHDQASIAHWKLKRRASALRRPSTAGRQAVSDEGGGIIVFCPPPEGRLSSRAEVPA
jgi:hypothetical protein